MDTLIENFFNNKFNGNLLDNIDELSKDMELADKIITNCEKLDDNITKKLYDYQIKHTSNIIHCLKNNSGVIDGSDTGTGKTYTTIASCKQLNYRPFIICPKSIMDTWKKVCKYFNVKPLGIVNYETIRLGKYYVNGKREPCPYLIKMVDGYKWKIPKDGIIVFDEVHRCRHINKLNGQLLLSVKYVDHCLLLSATIVDKIEDFLVYGFIINLYDDLRNGTNWIIKNNNIYGIHNKIYPTRGSRMKITDLGDKFPKNQILVDTYNNSNSGKITLLYNKIKTLKKNTFGDIVKARQEIEFLKIPIFVELTNDLINTGMSVVIFVNFTATLKKLADELKTNCIIYGQQTMDERHNNIEQFMENKKKVIICNIAAGGQAISLHDTNGDHPRVSLISPSFNSTDLIQALGRIHRAGQKSPSIQKIILCSNTIEDKIAENIKKKINCISIMNNNDLYPFAN